jgi:hypothetical protein
VFRHYYSRGAQVFFKEFKRVMFNKKTILLSVVAVLVMLYGVLEKLSFHRHMEEMLVNTPPDVNLEALRSAVNNFNAYELFFYGIGGPSALMPLLASLFIGVIASSSYIQDFKSGYAKFVISRTFYKKFFQNKIAAAALAGGLFILISELLFFMVAAAIYPLKTPENMGIITGFYENIYLSQPSLYLALILLIHFTYGALVALLGFGFSYLVKNVFAISMTPFLLTISLLLFVQFLYKITQAEGLFLIYPLTLYIPFTVSGNITLTTLLLAYLILLFAVVILNANLYKQDSKLYLS